MLPLAPSLSFPEAEVPLVLASVYPFQGPALTSPYGCDQHLTGHWYCQDVSFHAHASEEQAREKPGSNRLPD